MELSVTQENFARALAIVGRIASSRAGLPILGNVLLRTEANRLLVAATNLEIAATCYVGAKITKPGELTLPAKLISEFIASLPRGTVNIVSKGTSMTISSGNYSSIMSGVDAGEFPELPSIDENQAVTYTIAVADFKQAVSQTIITTSNDTSRPVLTGVYWHTDGGKLYLAGTDGYRLAQRRLFDTTSEIAAIVPTSSLQEVLRTISDSTDQVEVLFDDEQVRFRVDDSEITSRLIEGSYPKYQQLIPATSETQARVKMDDFSRIVKIAGLFARNSGGSVTVTVDGEKNNISIHSIASELGENTSSADAEVTGGGVLTLNSRYITDALGVIDGDSVDFRFSGKLSPCVLSPASENSDYIHIIMPLKS